jgi:uncharacterized heparinase superfamily protein
LVAEGFEGRSSWHQHMLEHWVTENPPGKGTGWEAYPLSLRIVNWIKWALAGGVLNAALVNSLAAQARYLSRRIEYHLLGNHLFANAKALVFAGAFYSGREADRWLSLGAEVLRSELKEQFLYDGGHFERSPMYHSILTEDLLDLIQLRQLYSSTIAYGIPGEIDPSPMLKWLFTMSHPDGDIGFFNDAAKGNASRFVELERYARDLGLHSSTRPESRSVHLESSGYVRLADDSAVLIIDVGQIGPDYLPAHAHADTLSFELSLRGKRVLVNSGTSTYTGAQRQWQRGTAAHNTISVDGVDSSEVWGSFRVARRAAPIDVRVEGNRVSAGHDGYRRLPGSPLHWREFELQHDQLVIRDRIVGAGSHLATLHFHALPGLEIERKEDRWIFTENRISVLSIRCPAGTESKVIDTEFSPEFGLSIANKTLVAQWQGPLPFCGESLISWGKAT